MSRTAAPGRGDGRAPERAPWGRWGPKRAPPGARLGAFGRPRWPPRLRAWWLQGWGRGFGWGRCRLPETHPGRWESGGGGDDDDDDDLMMGWDRVKRDCPGEGLRAGLRSLGVVCIGECGRRVRESGPVFARATPVPGRGGAPALAVLRGGTLPPKRRPQTSPASGLLALRRDARAGVAWRAPQCRPAPAWPRRAAGARVPFRRAAAAC
eukprot:scaffold2232_cov365-Prasinococcus_capsulatus_cf.AAC.1